MSNTDAWNASVNRQGDYPNAPGAPTSSGPIPWLLPDPRDDARSGMTLRDYFAAAALPAILEGDGYLQACKEKRPDDMPAAVAFVAYELADAMLRERERERDE